MVGPGCTVVFGATAAGEPAPKRVKAEATTSNTAHMSVNSLWGLIFQLLGVMKWQTAEFSPPSSSHRPTLSLLGVNFHREFDSHARFAAADYS